MNHLGTIELKTDRLILRKFKETDAEAIFNSFINNEDFLYKVKISENTLQLLDNKIIRTFTYTNISMPWKIRIFVI